MLVDPTQLLANDAQLLAGMVANQIIRECWHGECWHGEYYGGERGDAGTSGKLLCNRSETYVKYKKRELLSNQTLLLTNKTLMLTVKTLLHANDTEVLAGVGPNQNFRECLHGKCVDSALESDAGTSAKLLCDMCEM